MRARSIVCHFFYLRAFASSYVRTRRGVDGRFGHPFFFQKKNHASASSSVLAHAASISSSYAVLGGGGVLGLENEGSRQDEVVLIFGGFASIAEKTRGDDARDVPSRRLDTGTASSTASKARTVSLAARVCFVFFLRDTPRSGPISPRRASLDFNASATSRSTFPSFSISLRARLAGRPTSPSFVQSSKAGAMTCG